MPGIGGACASSRSQTQVYRTVGCILQGNLNGIGVLCVPLRPTQYLSLSTAGPYEARGVAQRTLQQLMSP